jgi:hypothetical protein
VQLKRFGKNLHVSLESYGHTHTKKPVPTSHTEHTEKKKKKEKKPQTKLYLPAMVRQGKSRYC